MNWSDYSRSSATSSALRWRWRVARVLSRVDIHRQRPSILSTSISCTCPAGEGVMDGRHRRNAEDRRSARPPPWPSYELPVEQRNRQTRSLMGNRTRSRSPKRARTSSSLRNPQRVAPCEEHRPSVAMRDEGLGDGGPARRGPRDQATLTIMLIDLSGWWPGRQGRSGHTGGGDGPAERLPALHRPQGPSLLGRPAPALRRPGRCPGAPAPASPTRSSGSGTLPGLLRVRAAHPWRYPALMSREAPNAQRRHRVCLPEPGAVASRWEGDVRVVRNRDEREASSPPRICSPPCKGRWRSVPACPASPDPTSRATSTAP